ncbi:formyl transferase [Methylobacterium sp. WL120]|uniref:glucosamine inositolphosphorylceramide transferase family protein n=1 Tax=Methylobacterium sp. WL120 TaxID=2603887 RepID=UPI0011CB72AE|nr:formyl transferase [Methylobacterium sp. WL120]TXM68819.1 formyl transferase [Methylobacterium sp. WL120]
MPDSHGPESVRLVLPGATMPSEEGTIWRIRFDGHHDEASLLHALLEGRPPLVEVVENNEVVLARGIVALDAVATLCDAYEAVATRLVQLVAMAIRAPDRRAPAVPITAIGSGSLGAYVLRRVARLLVRRMYRLCAYPNHWRTGWRFARSGETVWDKGTLDGAPWRVLTGPGHHFYADPFPFSWQGQSTLFVEDFDHHVGRAVISAFAFGPDGPVGPAIPVLEESFHLSYPFVFAHAGNVWMIPETAANRTVSLYRADPYPWRWVRDRDLLTDLVASDATVMKHGDRWWMFATLYDGTGSYSDTLGLFTASDLFGPWIAHPHNPIIIDAGMARPAGCMRIHEGRLWRPAQDCTQRYGGALVLAEVTELSESHFAQIIRHRIQPGPDWTGSRLHTINCAGGIEAIDGSAVSLKLFGQG